MSQYKEVVVAGHICLDVIPTMKEQMADIGSLLVPGKLIDIGTLVTSTGGAVSNTGIALHRLGVNTRLMGKVGNDLFGRAILDRLRGYGEHLTESMIVTEGEESSYTIVISPPGVDRIFLHCTGANDTFSSEDIIWDQLEGTRLFHFGYPPLMRLMYTEGGLQLREILSEVKKKGITVSLDMAKPDPDSEAGKVDWRGLLQSVLPYVDIFLPSIEEIAYMLRRDTYDQLNLQQIQHIFNGTLLSELSDELLEMGAAIVVIKLGEHGLYVRTTKERSRMEQLGGCRLKTVDDWLNRELYSPCFKVKVAGTTGAGDCTIAGFIAGLLEGLNPEAAVTLAVGVGACNVEQADATSGIPSLTEVRSRIGCGWERQPSAFHSNGWTWQNNDGIGISIGPNDKGDGVQC